MKTPACRGMATGAAPPPAPPTRSRASLGLVSGTSRARLSDRDQVANDLAEVGIFRGKDRLHSQIEQRLAILLGNDTAHHQANLAGATPLKQRQRLARNRHMRPRQARDREEI